MEFALSVCATAALVYIVSGSQYDICTTSALSTGGVGTSGDIVSPFYPESMVQSRTCRMTVTACPECRITLNFTDMQLPNCTSDYWSIGSCVYGCYHLYVHEPDYDMFTTNYYFGRDNGTSYTSLSNRIFLVLCVADKHYEDVKFSINYHITEKFQEYVGSVGGHSSFGYIESPNFPRGYAMRKEVYTYLIRNSNPAGLIRLGFDDWSLSPHSRITIYFHNDSHPEAYLTRTGKDERPLVLSTGPYLYLKFETGKDIYSIPYTGFKAYYHFVDEPYWPDKPYTVCGQFYHSLLGGNFSFDERTCWAGEKVDCIWVIMKYDDRCCDFPQAVALYITSGNTVQGDDSLEIRAGNSSEAPLISVYDHTNLTNRELVSDNGFYLRLRASCSNARNFKAVFASFANVTDEGCVNPYHFRCNNNRCLSFTLRCDGINHCGDYSDEFNCATTTMSTQRSCSTRYPCKTGKGWYCVEEQCDGIWACSDGSDERNCWITDTPTSIPPHSGFFQYHNWGTYIPVALVAILLAIIACIVISCCARRKHTRRRRQQRALANRMGNAGNVLPGQRMRSASETRVNMSVNGGRYPEAPPTYDEAMQFNPAEGVYNLAYSRTDSMDTFVPLPPPYTPNADDPLPIIYQLTSSQSAPDIPGSLGSRSANSEIPSVHHYQQNGDTGRRSGSSHNSQDREGRRNRARHRRRRSRGSSQNPANEDLSSLISAAQETAVSSSNEDNLNLTEDNTQPDGNTRQSVQDNTNRSFVNMETNDICDNALTDNVTLDVGDAGEFIELGDTLTVPSGVDPDTVTLQSGTSGSCYSGADSASGCSTLDQTSVNSLYKGKTHRRSVSGVSCISKSSVEPSVSKVDEEPCELKCDCNKSDCNSGVSCDGECDLCDKNNGDTLVNPGQGENEERTTDIIMTNENRVSGGQNENSSNIFNGQNSVSFA